MRRRGPGPSYKARLLLDFYRTKAIDMSRILSGTGSPETSVTADVATLYLRTDGGTSSTLYVKESGTGNTGWVAVGLVSGAVSLAMIQNITTDRLLGRDTTGSGVAEEITVGGGLEFTGSGGIQRSALTGDVTAAAGSGATTIAAGAVTAAMLGPDALDDVEADIAALDTRVDTAEADIVTLQAAKRQTVLWFGGAVMTAGTTDRFANPPGFSTSPIGATAAYFPCPVAGNFVAVVYRTNTAHTTNTVTIAMRLNGVEQTTQKVTVNANVTEQYTAVTSLPIAQLDAIACQMDHGGATNLANLMVGFVIEYD